MATKISFTQSGGFTGLTLGCELDGDLLSPEASAELEDLLAEWTGDKVPRQAAGLTPRAGDAADARRAEVRTATPAGARDLTSYTITVTTDQGSHAFTFDDATMPAEVEALLEQLRSCARPKR